MADTRKKQETVDKNYAAFIKMLPDLVKAQPGKFALIRDEKVEAFFDTARDALVAGQKLYPDGLFSIQQVVETSADLGFYSHAMHIGAV